jgi:hypothetical protein
VSPALSVTAAAVEVVAVTPVAGVIEVLVEPVAVVVDVAPEVCCEVLLPVPAVLEVPVVVEVVVTGVAAGGLPGVWLELDVVSAACAAGTVVTSSKLEHATANTRVATDRKLINMYPPWNLLLIRTNTVRLTRGFSC